ncbi:MAG: MBL fold metallo-hydrolase [Candidatus Altiarchaeota archaeon]
MKDFGGVAIGDDFLVDGTRFSKDRVNLITHAHFDHIPKKYQGEAVITTPLTADLVKHRREWDLPVNQDTKVTLLDGGHIPGSSMFLIEGKSRVLVTGDFNTKKSFFSQGAQAVETDILVVESTYGFPDYVFPDQKTVWGRAKDWIEELIGKDEKVVLMGYPLGKAQQICNFLDESGFEYLVDEKIGKVNEVLKNHGHSFKGKKETLLKEEKAPIVVTPVVRKDSPILKGKEDHHRAIFTGWATNPGYKYKMGVESAFPISDHCDYPSLIRFIMGCNPEIVYTHHGHDKFLAEEIKHQLDIEAHPLPKKKGLLKFI